MAYLQDVQSNKKLTGYYPKLYLFFLVVAPKYTTLLKKFNTNKKRFIFYYLQFFLAETPSPIYRYEPFP